MSDMVVYSIALDGDLREKDWWPRFLRDEFPSYELVWRRDIVPITRRPTSIELCSDEELASRGKSKSDICFAQLHYTVVCHIGAAFDIRAQGLDYDRFSDGIVRLCSAQDVALELLERHRSPSAYDLNSEGKSHKARSKWQEHDHEALAEVKAVRKYRNRLVHGRVQPFGTFGIAGPIVVPRLSFEDRYLDWRSARAPDCEVDFAPIGDVFDSAWKSTLNYLETAWRRHLLETGSSAL